MSLSLAVLCQDPAGPVARHRLRAVAPHLREAGFGEPRVHAIPRRLSARFALFRALREADLVLLLRKLFTGAELRLLRGSSRRLVYDVDDAVMYRDSFRSRPRSHLRARRFRAAVRAADLVLAGNTYLADHAAAAAETPVVLAPTAIDVSRYVPPAQSPQRCVAGWIGSRSTRPYLRGVQAALTRAEVPFAVLADRAPEMTPVPEFTPWSEAAEVPFLQSLAIGLMPLTDDPWSRGKCGFKLLQYMACGVPVVASPVGVNEEICAHGRTGLLARSEEEWVGAIRRLAQDREFARDLGARGRAHVAERYATNVLGPRYAAALGACAREEVVA